MAPSGKELTFQIAYGREPESGLERQKVPICPGEGDSAGSSSVAMHASGATFTDAESEGG